MPHPKPNRFTIRTILPIAVLIMATAFMTKPVTAAPQINNISDNRSQFSNSQIPRYEKLEITFGLITTASNLFYPYDVAPPPGIPAGAGVSVNAIFTSPSGEVIRQPAFYYQHFDEAIREDKAWYYPTGKFSWKVRFAPHQTGTWSYRLEAQDASGSTQSQSQTFTVTNSDNPGFLKVSPNDPRYFEFTTGTYFPGLGYNLNYRLLDWTSPHTNEPTFQIWQQNGLQLTRTWVSQWSIYGEVSSKWFSVNRAHIRNEPIMGIYHPGDNAFNEYPSLNPPPTPQGSQYYMWLNFDEEMFGDGTQWRFTPCRKFGWEGAAKIPLKTNTTYRLRVRYQVKDLNGPRVAGKPFGLVAKEGGWLWDPGNDAKNCYYPGTGKVIAASYAGSSWTNYQDPDNPGWMIMEGTYTNTNQNFFKDYLFLALENTRDPNGQSADDPNNRTSGGHAFIDHVYLEEDLGEGQYGPNLIYKPDMDHHTYVNQRDALALDRVLDLAKKYGVYIKAVILENNDRIFQTLGYNGELVAEKSNDFFYGKESREVTQSRWLQFAWFRYMQARWGYSPHIHSWELTNEGNPGKKNHLILTDELGKYTKCYAFGVSPVNNPDAGLDCKYTHPNVHLATTSFFSGFPWKFWSNADKLYADVDYADIHQYIHENDSADAEIFKDAALATQTMSLERGALTAATNKPVIRGEVGWSGWLGTNKFAQNVSQGLWLHNFIWGHINHGGLLEQYWPTGSFSGHLYDPKGAWDHRPSFKPYYDFIKDIPLNKGGYVDAAANATNNSLRVWGQKDTVNNRAHLWVQNKQHTWPNCENGPSNCNSNVTHQSGTITISGFTPNTGFPVERWDTYTGKITGTQTVTSNSSGAVTLSVSNLESDTAFRIGDYSSVSFNQADLDKDGDVDFVDYKLMVGSFNAPYTIFDFNDLAANFGTQSP